METDIGEDDSYSDTETDRRRDAALLPALSTPHKRQSEMKIGKAKPESGRGASPIKRGRRRKSRKEEAARNERG
jgi:hypothetical protein